MKKPRKKLPTLKFKGVKPKKVSRKIEKKKVVKLDKKELEKGIKKFHKMSFIWGMILFGFFLAITVGGLVYFLSDGSWVNSTTFAVGTLAIYAVYLLVNKMLKKSARIKKMESVFPDFIELMASNLRSGMTIDRALLLSSRKEFAPLDEEILHLGKDIMTGKIMSEAMSDMGKRIGSEKIERTINVINAGLRSGGNLAVLLEQTASSMRERDFIEKRATSNILMYVIFIFFAVSVGAPTLFALSTILVDVLTTIFNDLPNIDTSAVGASAGFSIPIAFGEIGISSAFVIYFSVAFIVVIDILASLMLGLVQKGDEKQGTKYIVPLVIVSLVIFFLVRYILSGYFADLFS